MEKFKYIKSTAALIAKENIDTDQIIPARFLKATSRAGFGENLFRDWRYHADGSLKEDFVLNTHPYPSKILVAGKNFGCGSSREHAAWALVDFGFRVVVSAYFADIFKNNALNNGLLPVQVSEAFSEVLIQKLKSNEATELEVDLDTQSIHIAGTEEKELFEINSYKKYCLQNGLDDIDFLLDNRSEIEAYEASEKKKSWVAFY
ncbi:MAG: 3-isopropylmalate dehydratase small subunit [Cyclobacteriaceae bacterium]|nr:3-isopropylmalate dehydratase small subunit [Cyclobacteriaceae bacterium]MCH8514766.1 3-isopropylmalate dehydratase small subunit [Cyclobacteriaceae bacterium]